MVRLSIIIPAWRCQPELEDTLVSVLTHRPANCEIIVVFPGPYEDPYQLRDEVRFIETSAAAGHVESANAGIEASKGEVVHLLDPGIEAVEGWTELPVRWLERDTSIAAVSPLIVAAGDHGPGDHGRIVSAGVRFGPGGRRTVVNLGLGATDMACHRSHVDGPTISSGFYRRSALISLGGFDARMGDSLADVDLAIRLRRLGYRCVFEPHRPLLGHHQPLRETTAGFRQGRCAERLFWRHLAIERRWSWLLVHPLEIATELLSRLPRLSAIAGLAGRRRRVVRARSSPARRRSPLRAPGDRKRPPRPTRRHGTPTCAKPADRLQTPSSSFARPPSDPRY